MKKEKTTAQKSKNKEKKTAEINTSGAGNAGNCGEHKEKKRREVGGSNRRNQEGR